MPVGKQILKLAQTKLAQFKEAEVALERIGALIQNLSAASSDKQIVEVLIQLYGDVTRRKGLTLSQEHFEIVWGRAETLSKSWQKQLVEVVTHVFNGTGDLKFSPRDGKLLDRFDDIAKCMREVEAVDLAQLAWSSDGRKCGAFFSRHIAFLGIIMETPFKVISPTLTPEEQQAIPFSYFEELGIAVDALTEVSSDKARLESHGALLDAEALPLLVKLHEVRATCKWSRFAVFWEAHLRSNPMP